MWFLGKVALDFAQEFGNSKNEVGFAAKIKVEFIFLNLSNAQKVRRDPSSRNFMHYFVKCDGVFILHYHNHYHKSKIAFDLVPAECEV